MRRRLFTILSALSLLLCVAVVALWVRSYWRHDSIHWTRHNFDDPSPRSPIRVETVTAESECGRAGLRWWRYESREWTGSVPDPGLRVASRSNPDYSSGFSNETKLGCWLHRSVAGVDLHFADTTEQRIWRIEFRMWLIAVATAALPGFRAFARSRRSNPAGICPACGYDLRATPDKCPECGTAAPPRKA